MSTNHFNFNSLVNSFEEQMAYTDDWRPQDWSQTYTTDSTSILVAADLHIPKHDIQLVSKMLAFAQEKKIDTCLLLGDLLDMEEFSFFGIDDATSSFKRNCKYAGDFVRLCCTVFREVVWSKGNHEERLSRSNKNHIDMDLLAGMCGLTDLVESKQLIIVESTIVYGSVGNWAYIHPAQYSRTPGKTPSDLAIKLQKNVVTAHEHTMAMVRDCTDSYWAIAAGGLFDPRYHKYIQHGIKSNSSWVQGFCTVIDGFPQIYHHSQFR